MNCRFCGTALPAGAQYCGECGRAVEAPAGRAVPASPATPGGPSTAALSFSSPESAAEPGAGRAAPAGGGHACPQCGEPIDGGDVFCGECGFVLPARAPHVAPDPVVETPAPSSADPEPAGAMSMFAPRPTRDPVLDPFPWGNEPRPAVDLEATRLVAGPSPEERFVLQFSTGESVTVTGAGLVGRNPASQPGEFVDQLVAIFDAGKSVSKTHLEFGQEAGRFWVSDRYSTNGSTVRQPDAEPKRCEPGRRYFVARGTRVDIGEQFFVVS